MYPIWKEQVIKFMTEDGMTVDGVESLHILGLLDLELLEKIIGKKSLSEIFYEVKKSPSDSFSSICAKLSEGERLQSDFLAGVFDRFFDQKILSLQEISA